MEWEKVAKSKFVGEKRFRSENPLNDNFFNWGSGIKILNGL